MDKLKSKKREIAAWCLYDFANSSYTTVIVTVAFSVYFTTIVAGGGVEGQRLWGWSYSGSMLFIALIAPMLGAIADYGGYKKLFLTAFTLICVVATSLLYFTEKDTVVYAIIIFAISNIGFNGAMHFYNSFLIDITTKANIGRISGYGWALGYIGGLLTLLLVYPLISGGFSEENLRSYRLSFPVTALFFFIAALPTLFILKERKEPGTRQRQHSKDELNNTILTAFSRLKKTFHEIRRFKSLTRYFISYFIYTDAVNTIIVFSAVFAAGVLKFTPLELITYFIITQFAAAGGAFIFAPITDKLGAKLSISITLTIWTVVVIATYFVETKFGFYIIGGIAGAVLGANQSASRALLGLFTPHGKNAEFFGFFALAGKLSAVIGPVIYAEITSFSGSQRPAVLSLSIFFIAGLILLQFVDIEGGIKAAVEFEEDSKNNPPQNLQP